MTQPIVSPRSISMSRLVNAPRELVWKVWTEPDHIKNWWGPVGFTNTISKMDVKVGGEWIFVMHGPDGTDFKNRHTYRELKKPERIVLYHETSPNFEMTVTFTEQGNKTLVEITSLFESGEQLKHVIKEFKADEGARQNMDRMEAYLLKFQA